MGVLAPGIGEIIGAASARSGSTCSMRAWPSFHVDREHYAWYRYLRRYGRAPHAGFGLGLERTLAYVTGLANVPDAIPFPHPRQDDLRTSRFGSALCLTQDGSVRQKSQLEDQKRRTR